MPARSASCLVILLIAAAAPLPLAHSACNPTQHVHTYVSGPPNVWTAVDSCTSVAPGYTAPGDGDPDLGQTSGMFPAYQPCLDFHYAASSGAPPPVAHHDAYDGASFVAYKDPLYWWFPTLMFAGTDGPIDPLLPCIGDGIITDASPVDCGAGGWYARVGQDIAEVRANGPDADCSKPADGMVHVYMWTGPFPWFNNEVGMSVPGAGVLEQVI